MATATKRPDVFTPPFRRGSKSFGLCVQMVRELAKWQSDCEEAHDKLEVIRSGLLSEIHKSPDEQVLRVILAVLVDLTSQGWDIATRGSRICVARPETTDREQVRASHAIGREQQLRLPSVRSFIRRMEKRQLTLHGSTSVFSLMRDGRELAEALRNCIRQSSVKQRLAALKTTIDPYIQIVRPGAICPLSGYDLSDIWRYFRHTWITSYKSAVGREMKVLIRDRATPNHAIIGIGAMVSPRHLVHVDRWVGWERRAFLQQLADNASADWAKWLDRSLARLIADIHVKDFIVDRILKQTHILKPTQAVIDKLATEAEAARAAHRLYPNQAEHKGEGEAKLPANWEVRACTNLYRGNRAAALAELLRVRLILTQEGFVSSTKASLQAALGTSKGRDAIATILKYVKSVHAGINVLDISVCGAVAPYGPILGGKLVAMMLTSPEIAKAYFDAYKSSPSIIASAMAGRPVVREPHLVLLTTSSLYGNPLNQYTRVSIPGTEVGGREGDAVRYIELGTTLGQGSHHISDDTVEEAEALLTQRADGHRINSIFGEGVNPRLRKIRSVLDVCGFDSNYVLEHGNPRVLYGVALATNFKDVLIGRAKVPTFILPMADALETTRSIADYWKRRWLLGRIQKNDILSHVEAHSLIHPITHGARVVLPTLDGEAGPLFRAFGDD